MKDIAISCHPSTPEYQRVIPQELLPVTSSSEVPLQNPQEAPSVSVLLGPAWVSSEEMDHSRDKTTKKDETEQQFHHVSIYSMDSFVEDFPSGDDEYADADDDDDEEPGQHQNHDDNDAVAYTSTYFSPSSSTTLSDRTTGQASQRQQEMQNPSLKEHFARHDTNDDPPARKLSTDDPVRKMSSDVGTIGSDSLPPVQPSHPFFSQSFLEEAEMSDGSIIFNPVSATDNAQTQQVVAKPTTPHHRKESRDRFPSFDSLGSSGSLRYVPPNTQASKPPPPTVTTSQATPSSMLPYHERRKILKQKQEQQKQKQQLQREGTPAEREPARQDRNPMPYMIPPPPPPHAPVMPMRPPDFAFYQQAMQQQQPFPPYPPTMMMAPHPMAAGYPYPPGASAAMGYYPQPPPQFQSQFAYGMPPPPPQGAKPTFIRPTGQGKYPTPPPQESGSRPPPAGKMSGQRPPTLTRPPIPQQQSPPPVPMTYTSSFDSSDGGIEQPALPPPPVAGIPRPQRRAVQPPPPPPPPTHVRRDSSGSVSSLGSLDRSGHDEMDEDAQRASAGVAASNSGAGKGLFGQLASWGSHRSVAPAPPKEHSVTDFHKRNQAFLSSVEKQSQQIQQQQQSVSQSPRQISRRVPLNSLDRPPATGGSHRRLPSIDNDNWDEEAKSTPEKPGRCHPAAREGKQRHTREPSSSGVSLSSEMSSDYDEDDDAHFAEATEKSKLLPPSGISSNEYYDGRRSQPERCAHSSKMHHGHDAGTENEDTLPADNTATALLEYKMEQAERRRQKKMKRKQRKQRQGQRTPDDQSEASVSSSSASSREYKRWLRKRAKILEKERAKLIKQWKAEAKAEEESARREEEVNRWYRRLGRYVQSETGSFVDGMLKFLMWAEAFIANLPLTIGAIANAIAYLGVVWFKFAEENMKSCEPVHFHSAQCTFPEFPGCFYCDTKARVYQIALNFHFACSAVAGILALSFIAKIVLAWRVVFDELSSPTTASPAGLLCMTLDMVAAGRGLVGMVVVSVASSVHLCLAIWFIYMALAYHIMPDPSWFPNTVCIGISAVKTWLYHPTAGHFLMAISLSLNFFLFPISVIRVALNRKISATVAWLQMTAPNVSLYALTIMAQPSFTEEHPDINDFQRVHRLVYLPCMHFLFALCITGMLASVTSLITRWSEFSKYPFSPAHAAFCVPTLAHANAIQAYRGAINSFSTIPVGSPLKKCLYLYWVFWLLGGTILTLIISLRFLYKLPAWTHIDVEGEIEPPQPFETSMTLSNMIATGETLVQPFVSPAILQANETGALILAKDEQGHRRYVRTRMVTALGFEPIMNVIAMEQEREVLLEWVGKHPPRRRHRTLSVPGIDFSYGASAGVNIGTGHTGVFGMEEGTQQQAPQRAVRRQRASSTSPYVNDRRRPQF